MDRGPLGPHVCMKEYPGPSKAPGTLFGSALPGFPSLWLSRLQQAGGGHPGSSFASCGLGQSPSEEGSGNRFAPLPG